MTRPEAEVGTSLFQGVSPVAPILSWEESGDLVVKLETGSMVSHLYNYSSQELRQETIQFKGSLTTH